MTELLFRRGYRGTAVACLCLVMLAGCTELRGRRRIREGNRLYREGRYAAALEQYRMAETLDTAVAPLVAERRIDLSSTDGARGQGGSRRE